MVRYESFDRATLILVNSFFFFYLLLRRLISDHYLRSCGYVTCSWPQQTATGGLESGPLGSVLGFTTAPVRSISARDSSAQIICFLLGPGLHSLAIILILTLALVSKSKGLSASTTIKRVLHFKGLRGSIKLERNARNYHNQTKCKEV